VTGYPSEDIRAPVPKTLFFARAAWRFLWDIRVFMLQPLCRRYFISCGHESTPSPLRNKPRCRAARYGLKWLGSRWFTRHVAVSTTYVADLRVANAEENKDMAAVVTLWMVSWLMTGGDRHESPQPLGHSRPL